MNIKKTLYLPKSAVIEEAQSMRLVIRAILIMSLIVFALILWASLTTVDDITSASGEIKTGKKVNIIQHLEGGIITKIYVQNGDKVEVNDIIAQLDTTGILSELDNLKAKAVSLTVDAVRLQQYVHNNDLPTSNRYLDVVLKFQKKYSEEIENMIKEDEELLSIQRFVRSKLLSIHFSQVKQRGEDLVSLTDKLIVSNKNLNLLYKEKDLYDGMGNQALYSQAEYLGLLKKINEGEGEVLKVKSELRKAKESLNEAKQKLYEADANLLENATKELGSITSELLQTHRALSKLSDRMDRTSIRANIAGIIKGLDITVGGVITSGGIIAEVIPKHSTLKAEIKIKAKDIGHVGLNDKVNVKVMTFDYARFGGVEGKLHNISASTFVDESDGEPYYRGVVHLDKEYVGSAHKLKLIPGMTIQADISTGEKSLLAYLLKPIRNTINNSFTEK